MENVIKYSEKIKQQADALLDCTKVLDVLGAFGEVNIGGAYELDLMYDPDIDIRVYCENPREASVAALEQFVSQRNFQKYQYGDFEKFNRENRPKSFIIVLIIPFEGLKWEIEIWFYGKDEKKDDSMAQKLKTNMTEDIKREILEAKLERNEKGITKHELSSMQIYEEVLKRHSDEKL